jgi:hypothetical protein
MIRKITLGITLLFSTLMFASPAYADWEKIGKNENGTTFYVDFDRIRKNGSYVYWWDLSDRLEPMSQGVLSYKEYSKGDCKEFRYKVLSYSYFKQPMGEGQPLMTDSTPDTEWKYPTPNSAGEVKLRQVCWVSAIRFPVYP